MSTGILTRRRFLAIGASMPLVACDPVPDLLIVPEAAQVGSLETVFAASNRVFRNGAFEDTRQQRLQYTHFTISIPPNRDIGSVDPGRTRSRTPDAETEFVATEGYQLGNSERFRQALQQEAQRRDTREVMVFVHGFNNTFGTGIYRTAQIRHDFDVPSIAVHFAWPSAGHPLGYAYDRDSALFARDGLEQLVSEIVSAGLNVVLVAHSLGAGVVMEVLRQLRIGGRDSVISRINGVILFSPDIDIDVFRLQATRIGELPQPFVIFTSQRDRALTISARITGLRERVGNLSSAEELMEFEVTLVDTTAFESGAGDPLNHFSAATSPAAVQILRDMVRVNDAFERDPTQQTGLLPGTILTIQNATQVMLTPLSPR